MMYSSIVGKRAIQILTLFEINNRIALKEANTEFAKKLN